jgi:hypothetical protein
MGCRVGDDLSSTSCLNALLSVYEAGVEILWRHRVVTVVHHLDEVVVVAVEAGQNILYELCITKRLPMEVCVSESVLTLLS